MITFPRIEPVEHRGWHLQVVAIALDHQKKGLSRQVFEETFVAMREIDDSRVCMTAHVHNDHHPSLKACASVGLSCWMPKDEHYSTLFGEVPPG